MKENSGDNARQLLTDKASAGTVASKGKRTGAGFGLETRIKR
jgi:hypothetical protein